MNPKTATPARDTRVLIIGAGEVGFHTARRLAEENKQVVVADLNEERLQAVADALDVQTLQGAGSSPKTLEDAGIQNMDIVLAVTDSDEVNIMACMFAKALAPHTIRLARVRNPEYALYPTLLSENLKINLLVNPEEETVRSTDRLLTLPGAVEYHEFAGGRVRMVGIKVSEGPLIGQPLSCFRNILHDEGIMVGAIVRNETLIIPSGCDSIEADDVVYFVFQPRSMPVLLRNINRSSQFLNSVCICGGGTTGERLAQLLEAKGILVKLIERSPKRCHELAAQLNSTLVLNGDGTDKTLLEEERIGEMDAFVAMTDDEESNILAALLAKSLGTKITVVMVNKNEYRPLIDAIGIDHVVSPRVSAVNSILHYIRQGRVLASVSVGQEAAEAMEVIVSADAAIAGSRVQDMGMPKGALLLTVIRGGEVLIPTGQTVIHAKDRLLLLTMRPRISEIEEMLTQKKELRS